MEPRTPIIYERVDGTIYGRFVDSPDVPRWVVTQETIATHPLTLRDFSDILELSRTNPTLKTALDNLALFYNMVKDDK